jgi:hypothetical protein
MFPDVAFHNGALWYVWMEGTRLTVTRDGVEILKLTLPGSLGFPRLHSWAGVLWLAYHDGTDGQLQSLDPMGDPRTLTPCQNNDPICFGDRWVAWQGAAQYNWPITRMDLETNVAISAGMGAGTGLSRVLVDGTVRTIDQDRFIVPGVTRPTWAADLTVAEGPGNSGVAWSLTDGRKGVLWPGVPSWTPRCASDPDRDRVAVVTWGGPTREPWIGTRADLSAVPVPVDPIVRIGRAMWGGWFVFGATPATLPGNCIAQVGPIGKPLSEILVYSTAGQVVAQYVAAELPGQSIATEIAKARIRHPRVPVLAYWSRKDHAGPVPPADWIGVEAYRGATESVAAFETRVSAAVVRCSKAVLIAQVYTSNAANTLDLVSIPPVIARIARYFSNVVGILGFSGAGRATGYEDHPEVHAAWTECYAGIPSAPPIVVLPVPAPVPIPIPIPVPVPQPTPEETTTMALNYDEGYQTALEIADAYSKGKLGKGQNLKDAIGTLYHLLYGLLLEGRTREAVVDEARRRGDDDWREP